MTLVLCALAAALVLGLSLGGSWHRLGATRLVRPGLVVAALATQVGGALLGGPAVPLSLLASAVLVAGFLASNRGLRGTGLVALGLGLNALVVLANGAMPVSLEASGRAGVSTQRLLLDGGRHEAAGADTRLPWLGDVVPVRAPVRPEVVSVGDLLVTAGLAQLVLLGLLGRQPGADPALPPAGRRARLEPDPPGSHEGGPHGEEGSQAPRAQEEQGQPRPPSQRLSDDDR